ncbi:ADP-ribosylglycohydrolase family protein [Deinococcus hopiensis]|uniref:ADP-ribosylglycohydrolase family protein n=1 Tax=Deinococcus hopiensis TaxID=309885 RepID=UPI001BAFF23E
MNSAPPGRSERISGGLIGLLIGDALGVPYEFHGPCAITPFPQIEFEPPAGFQRPRAGVPPGTWSDDGAQAPPFSRIPCWRVGVSMRNTLPVG